MSWDSYFFKGNTKRMYSKTYSPRDVIKCLEMYKQLSSFRKASLATGIGKSTIQRWWVSLRHVFRRSQKRKKRTRRRTKYFGIENIVTSLFQSDQATIHSLKQIKLAVQSICSMSPCLSSIHSIHILYPHLTSYQRHPLTTFSFSNNGIS